MITTKLYLTQLQIDLLRPHAPSSLDYDKWLEDCVTVLEPFFDSEANDAYAVELGRLCHEAWLFVKGKVSDGD